MPIDLLSNKQPIDLLAEQQPPIDLLSDTVSLKPTTPVGKFDPLQPLDILSRQPIGWTRPPQKPIITAPPIPIKPIPIEPLELPIPEIIKRREGILRPLKSGEEELLPFEEMPKERQKQIEAKREWEVLTPEQRKRKTGETILMDWVVPSLISGGVLKLIPPSVAIAKTILKHPHIARYTSAAIQGAGVGLLQQSPQISEEIESIIKAGLPTDEFLDIPKEVLQTSIGYALTSMAFDTVGMVAKPLLFRKIQYSTPSQSVIPIERHKQIQGGAPTTPMEEKIRRGETVEYTIPREWLRWIKDKLIKPDLPPPTKALRPYLYQEGELKRLLKRDAKYTAKFYEHAEKTLTSAIVPPPARTAIITPAPSTAPIIPYYEDVKNIPALAQKIVSKAPITPDDLQLQKNFPKEVESEINKIAIPTPPPPDIITKITPKALPTVEPAEVGAPSVAEVPEIIPKIKISDYGQGRKDTESIYREWGIKEIKHLAKYKPTNDYERGKIDRAKELLEIPPTAPAVAPVSAIPPVSAEKGDVLKQTVIDKIRNTTKSLQVATKEVISDRKIQIDNNGFITLYRGVSKEDKGLVIDQSSFFTDNRKFAERYGRVVEAKVKPEDVIFTGYLGQNKEGAIFNNIYPVKKSGLVYIPHIDLDKSIAGIGFPKNITIKQAFEKGLLKPEVKPKITPAPQEIAKEPYQMTKKEIEKEYAFEDVNTYALHTNAIKQALSEGKTVPANVLKDYPELQKEVKPTIKKGDVVEITERGIPFKTRVIGKTKDGQLLLNAQEFMGKTASARIKRWSKDVKLVKEEIIPKKRIEITEVKYEKPDLQKEVKPAVIPKELEQIISEPIKIRRLDLTKEKKLGTYSGDIIVDKNISKIPKERPELYNYAPKTEKGTILHELGHDIELKLPDKIIAKFNTIKGKEFHPKKYNVAGGREPMTWPEDFAESFSKWSEHPDIFRKEFPQRAKFFDDLGLKAEIGKDSVKLNYAQAVKQPAVQGVGKVIPKYTRGKTEIKVGDTVKIMSGGTLYRTGEVSRLGDNSIVVQGKEYSPKNYDIYKTKPALPITDIAKPKEEIGITEEEKKIDEFFNKQLSPSQLKKIISEKTGITIPTKIIRMREDIALRKQIRDEARGSRIGFKEGEKITKEQMITNFKAGQQRIEDVVEYIKQNLPINEQGKFINAVKNARTAARQFNIFARVDRLKEEIERKVLISEIKELSKPKGNIIVEYHRLLKNAISDIDLVNPTELTIRKLKGLANYISRNGVPLGINPKRLEQLNRLTKKPIKIMTTEELTELKNTMEHLRAMGMLKLKLINRYHARQQALNMSKLLNSTQNLDIQPTKFEKLDKIRKEIKEIYINTLHTIRVADMIDGYKGYGGENAKYIKQLATLENRAKMNTVIDTTELLEKIRDVKLVWTEQEQRDIVLLLHNEQGQFEQVQSIISEYGYEKIPEKTEEYQKIMDLIRNYYKKDYTTIQAIHEEKTNEILGEVKNYFPIKYEREFNILPSESVNPQRFRRTQVEKGFTFGRKPGVEKIPRTDLFGILEESIGERHWYIGMQPELDNIAELVKSEEFHKKAGDTVYTFWANVLDVISRRGWSASAQPNFLLKQSRINLNNAILGYKVSSIVMQPFAIFDALAYSQVALPSGASYEIVKEFLKVWIIPNYAEGIVKGSYALKLRKGGELAIEETLQENKNVGKIYRFIKDNSLSLLQWADIKTAAGVHRGVYEVLQKHNVPNAKEEADTIMNLVSGSNDVTLRPLILSKGEGARTWFTFQTFFLNRWGITIHDLIISGLLKSKGISKKLWALIGLGILSAGAVAEKSARKKLYELITGKESKPESTFKTIAMTVPSQVPYFGNLLEAGLGGYGADPPLIKTLENTFKGFGGIVQGKTVETKKRGAMRLSESLIGLTLGIPGTSQFFDILERVALPEKKPELPKLSKLKKLPKLK